MIESSITPTISDSRLIALMEKLLPVLQKDGDLLWIRPEEPRETSFTWEPEFCGKALDLIELRKIESLHSSPGFYGFFKPTIAECLAYVTDEDIDNGACAFTCQMKPHDHWREITIEHDKMMYHKGIITLYKTKSY